MTTDWFAVILAEPDNIARRLIFADWLEEQGDPAATAMRAGAMPNSVGMRFAPIPPGTFLMGSPPGAPGRYEDEGPQHLVTVPALFHMAIYPVTQQEYREVMGKNPSHFQGSRGGPNHPVEQVSWEDAVAFCERLSALPAEQEAGRAYRLPTEAEWEYACRAGTTTAYSFGDNPELLGEYAWFAGNSDGTTHEVGQKKPNPWGLYDMHGNVWEWCQDWYRPYSEAGQEDPGRPFVSSVAARSTILPGTCARPSASGTSRRAATPSPASASSNEEEPLFRVLRGGTWNQAHEICRAAFRGEGTPRIRSDRVGFRVVCVR